MDELRAFIAALVKAFSEREPPAAPDVALQRARRVAPIIVPAAAPPPPVPAPAASAAAAPAAAGPERRPDVPPRPAEALRVTALFANPQSLVAAFIVGEVLAKPVALREP